MRARRGQRIGPYRVIEQVGVCRNGKPLWLCWSFPRKQEVEVTEMKIVKLGKKTNFA